MLKKLIYTLCIILAAAFFVPPLISSSNAVASADSADEWTEPFRFQLTSREYKILLKPEKFKHAADGASTYWNLVEDLATQMGIVVKKDPDCEKYETRYIHYLDTPDHEIRKTGYILRIRQPKGDKRFELSLKYRSKDEDLASQADVALSEEFDADVKFEEDISVKGTDLILSSVFSLRNRTDRLKKIPGNALKDYAKLFPVLKKIGIDVKKQVKPVNDIIIKEKVFSPGTLYFDNNIKCRTSISVWKVKGRGNQFIAEFSFKNKFKGSHLSLKDKRKLKQFFLTLNKKSKNWKAFGTTKTSMVYSNN